MIQQIPQNAESSDRTALGLPRQGGLKDFVEGGMKKKKIK